MSLSISLVHQENIEAKLVLSKVKMTIDDIASAVVVYQDLPYKLVLNDEDGSIKNLSIDSIMINNQEVKFKNFRSNSGCCEIILESPPFRLVYGITDISIIFKNEENCIIFYSPLLAVAIKEDFTETMQSIHEMLNDIYMKEHHLLRTNLNEKKATSNAFNLQSNKYSQELAVLKKIINELADNLVKFVHSPKVHSVASNSIDSFEKAKTINSLSVRYITTHPNELNPIPMSTGICFWGQNYLPRKTLIENVSYNKNTVENHMIIAFLNTLEFEVSTKIEKLITQLDTKTSDLYEKEQIKSGYTVSFLIIEQYLKISFKEYLLELKKIHSALKILVLKYKKVLIEHKNYIKSIPTPTPTFLEIHHYRRIYECILSWFSLENFSVPKNNEILHFYTADRIYEYYCLLNIADILYQLGWIENFNRRDSFNYDVPEYEQLLYNKCSNTFYFSKGDHEQIILLYQPVIYSTQNSKNNNIELFCTQHGKYYTPDFIIKHIITEKEISKIKYGILDAKWRNQRILKKKNENGGFEECIYKYFASVANQDLSRVPFMWLLQGKDDNNKIYFHHNGSIAKTKGEVLLYSSGIVPLTPKSGFDSLLLILSKLIK